MSGTDAAGDGTDGVRKRATLRTRHDDPAVVARAVRPDNTDAMETTVDTAADTEGGEAGGRPSSERRSDGGHVVTRIERPTTGGLRSTVDDYVVNLRVAERVAATARGEDATGVDNRDEATVDTNEDANEASDGTNDSDITTDDTHDT